MQDQANVRFEAAKKIAEILEEAKKTFKAAGGTAEEWESYELEAIQDLAFGGE